MKRILTTLALAAALVVPQTAALAASPPLEEGVTFLDGGACVEADGTEGLSRGDGQCITPADYDILFGFANLSETDSQTSDVSVAEEAGIVEDVASQRPIGAGLVAEEDVVSFVTKVNKTHAWLSIS